MNSQIPKSIWIYGSFAFSFLVLGLLAPWIANEPKGNAVELLNQTNVLLQDVKTLDDKEGFKNLRTELLSLRRSLLGIPHAYNGPEDASEKKIVESLGELKKEAAFLDSPNASDFLANLRELEFLIETRQSALFPLIKKGPVVPLAEFQEKDRAPDSEYLFGTDRIGRDIFSFTIHGIRNSLFFALVVVVVCFGVGVILGGVMGYFGGWPDLIMQRVQEIIGNFPFFLLMLTLLAFMPSDLPAIWRYIIIASIMCAVGWIPYARYTRAEFLRLRQLDFATAAKAIGASGPRRFFVHLLPNAMTPNITFLPFDIASTIAGLGALSFIGFGEPPGTASLGELLSVFKESVAREGDLRNWWLAVFPGSALFLLTLAFVLFGASIRDYLDPRYQERD